MAGTLLSQRLRSLGPKSVGLILALAPDMAAKVSAAIAALISQGIVPMITSGFRTAADQLGVQNSAFGAGQVSWYQVGEAVDIRFQANSEHIASSSRLTERRARRGRQAAKTI
jgi:hypothetical protein